MKLVCGFHDNDGNLTQFYSNVDFTEGSIVRVTPGGRWTTFLGGHDEALDRYIAESDGLIAGDAAATLDAHVHVSGYYGSLVQSQEEDDLIEFVADFELDEETSPEEQDEEEEEIVTSPGEDEEDAGDDAE